MSVERFDAVCDDRMIYPVPLGVKRHQGIDPRRLNATPGPIRILMFDNPVDTKTNREFPARLKRKFDVSAQESVRHEKETFPGKKPLYGSKSVIKTSFFPLETVHRASRRRVVV